MSNNTDVAVLTGKILELRGRRVILAHDLAALYGVETKVLNQAIKRNMEKFPGDFMFQLNTEDLAILRSQIVTSSWGGARYLPPAPEKRKIGFTAKLRR
jgi:hypothetical protein